jgi:hypothetical protein
LETVQEKSIAKVDESHKRKAKKIALPFPIMCVVAFLKESDKDLRDRFVKPDIKV